MFFIFLARCPYISDINDSFRSHSMRSRRRWQVKKRRSKDNWRRRRRTTRQMDSPGNLVSKFECWQQRKSLSCHQENLEADESTCCFCKELVHCNSLKTMQKEHLQEQWEKHWCSESPSEWLLLLLEICHHRITNCKVIDSYQIWRVFHFQQDQPGLVCQHELVHLEWSCLCSRYGRWE